MALNYAALLFSPRGRVRRRLYWRATLVLIAASWCPYAIPRIGLYLGAAASVAALYGFVCLYTKRFHDLGRSGWWQIVLWGAGLSPAILAPLALGILAESGMKPGFGDEPGEVTNILFALSVLATMVFAGCHIALGVLRGETGMNRFDGDPAGDLDVNIFD